MAINTNELRTKRVELNKQCQDILAKVDEEKRKMLPEERQKLDAMYADMDDLKLKIDSAERSAQIDKELGQHIGDPAKPSGKKGDERSGKNSSPEYRDAFFGMLRRGKAALNGDELRAMTEGSDPDGGYLVPTSLNDKIVLKLQNLNFMRALATVINTSSDKNIPIDNDDGDAFWTGETVTQAESADTLGNIMLSAHKLARITKVSEELMNDSAFDIESHLALKIGQKMASKEEAAFVLGTGSGQPTGVFVDGTLGVTTAANNAITPEEIIDLFYALKQAYRKGASWVMNSSLVKTIRKMKATTGDFIWQPGLKANEPDLLMGRPIYESAAAPAFAANTKVIAFGDMSYYWIAMREAVRIQRLNELYAANGFVGFRAYERVDGKLVMPEAVQILKIKS